MKIIYYFSEKEPERGIFQFTVLSETYLINETTKEKNLFSINTHFDIIKEVETDKNYSLNIFNPCEDEDIYKYDFLNELILSYDKKKLEKIWETKVNYKKKRLKEELLVINNLKKEENKEEWLRKELSEFAYSSDFFSKILEIIDNIPEKEAEEDKILKFELEDLRKRHQKSCDKLEDIRKYLERQPKDKVILELQDLLEKK